MLTIEDEIRSQTEAFAMEIANLVRRAALDAVTAALGTAGVTAPDRPAAKRGRPGKRAAAAPVAKTRGAAKAAKAPAAKVGIRRAAAPTRAPGEKRPPAELAKLTEKLVAYIKGQPGQRMEAIAKALGTATRELNLPVKKLLAAKKIRIEGHKRATEYFPA